MPFARTLLRCIVGRLYIAKSKIDPGCHYLFSAGQRVLPVMLGFPVHEQQTAVTEAHGMRGLNCSASSQQQFTFRTNTDAGNYRAGPQCGLIVGMPAHAVVAIAIKVDQYTVKACTGVPLDFPD